MSYILENILSGIPEATEEPEPAKEKPMDYSTDFEKEYGKKA